MIALKIVIAIILIIFCLMIYSCIKVAGDCDREEENNNDGN